MQTTRSPLGWILAGAVILISLVFLWRIGAMIQSRGRGAVGDGLHPHTYGFDLSNFSGDLTRLVGSGVARDGIPVLDFPPIWTRAVVDSLSGEGRAKYLVSGDRVIGVRLHGCERAYPLIALNWHEVINDTLGGVPIAVTYSPLCDAAVVYERRILTRARPYGSGDGAAAPSGVDSQNPSNTEATELLLGHRGLLHDSNPLLYDRDAPAGRSSLWQQLTGLPMSGPAAAEEAALTVVPCQLVWWSEWKERYPQTTVPARAPERKAAYKREPYTSYFGNDLLRFPAAPLPDTRELPLKAPCVILGEPPAATVYPLALIARHADPEGRWLTRWSGRPVLFTYRQHPATTWVEFVEETPPPGLTSANAPTAGVQTGAAPVQAAPMTPAESSMPSVRHAFRFAWHALTEEGADGR